MARLDQRAILALVALRVMWASKGRPERLARKVLRVTPARRVPLARLARKARKVQKDALELKDLRGKEATKETKAPPVRRV
ncbi:hypothetical protein FACS18947_4640 [Bacteroidia bacterium]|nr:hypothetical protein FACS18947_4640 [Bacteroidia bacterium]